MTETAFPLEPGTYRLGADGVWHGPVSPPPSAALREAVAAKNGPPEASVLSFSVAENVEEAVQFINGHCVWVTESVAVLDEDAVSEHLTALVQQAVAAERDALTRPFPGIAALAGEALAEMDEFPALTMATAENPRLVVMLNALCRAAREARATADPRESMMQCSYCGGRFEESRSCRATAEEIEAKDARVAEALVRARRIQEAFREFKGRSGAIDCARPDADEVVLGLEAALAAGETPKPEPLVSETIQALRRQRNEIDLRLRTLLVTRTDTPHGGEDGHD